MAEDRSNQALSLPASLVGIWNWTVHSDLVIACDRVSEYFGIEPEEGRHGVSMGRLIAAVAPSDQPELYAAIENSLATSAPFNATFTVISQRHGTRLVSASAHCFHGAAGQLTYLSGILSDAGDTQGKAAVLEQATEHLISAAALVSGSGMPVLHKLIQAVLLEVGRELAASTPMADA